jgi:beta-lactam-binding protein with PASTA domain
VRVNYVPRPCNVPKLTGKTLSAAKLALTRAHCALGKVTQRRARQVRQGRVISQGLKAGTSHKPLTRVSLVISRGA